MTGTLAAAAVVVPALLTVIALVPALRALAGRLAAVAPIPALAAAVMPTGTESELSIILTGIGIGLDDLSPPFLVLTAIVWMAASLHARLDRHLAGGEHAALFVPSFLLAMTGNIGVVVSLDPIGFYLFFTLLTLGSYGIVLSGGPQARQPAALFLAFSLAGEMAMLAGFMLESEAGGAAAVIAVLLFFGMGVKHAVVPLHVWTPPAYGATPIAGAAALAGALAKAGLLGWLRFLPELAGEEGLAALPPFMVGCGLAGAFLGAAAGLFQQTPKTALAYSSVSQLGLMTGATALAAASLDDWEKLTPVLTLFALHHALVKGALFLTVQAGRGGGAGRAVFPAQVALSLAIAAFPLTGGALFKLWLEEEAHASEDPWLHAFEVLLPYTSIASALVLARFLWLARPGRPIAAGLSPWPALALSAAALVAPWVYVAATHGAPFELALGPKPLWKTFWPAATGIAISLVAVMAAWRGAVMPAWVPPGDIGVWLAALVRRVPLDPVDLRQRAVGVISEAHGASGRPVRRSAARLAGRIRRLEHAFRSIGVIGGVFTALLLALALGALAGA